MDNKGVKRKYEQVFDEITEITYQGHVVELLKSLWKSIDKMEKRYEDRISELEDTIEVFHKKLEKANKRLKKNKLEQVYWTTK